MNRIKQWFATNKSGLTLLSLAALYVGISLTAMSCTMTLRKLIPVQVPPHISEALPDKPTQVTLADAERAREQYLLTVKQSLEKFDENIYDAAWLVDVMGALGNWGLEAAEGPLSALPGGAAGFALLTGLGGLFLRKPGTDKQVQKEKESSYNRGLQDAEKLLMERLLVTGERAANRAVDNLVDRAVDNLTSPRKE